LVFNFLCLQIGGEICTTDEADDVRWFSRHDIPPNVSPRQLARIQDAYDQPEEVLLRNQL
jgi:NADH pyrophosphatase NudC (nudix superfamily)